MRALLSDVGRYILGGMFVLLVVAIVLVVTS